MKIAIYGDSYAARYPKARKEIHWYNILSKLLNVEINTFARVGSSLYFSYINFLENYEKYDCNIFLVTNPYRYTRPIRIANDDRFIHSTEAIDSLLENQDKRLTDSDIETLEHLRSWFLVSDDKYMRTMHDLMIADIVRRDNDIIMYPCFKNSRISETDPDSFMYNWTLKCHNFFNIEFEDYSETTNIACHMTEEINQKFAEAMYKRIKTGKEIYMPENIEHKHNLEHYYIRKKSKGENP